MPYKKRYEEKYRDLRGIMSTLEGRFGLKRHGTSDNKADGGTKFSSMVEIYPNNTCGQENLCTCSGYVGAGADAERVEELEDYILELKEQIFNLQKQLTVYQERQDAEGRMRNAEEARVYDLCRSVGDLAEGMGRGGARIREVSGAMSARSEVLRSKLGRIGRELKAKSATISSLNLQIEQISRESAEKILAAEKAVLEGAVREKRLRNEIQDLKGSIRVFCRIRPPLDGEDVLCRITSDLEHVRIAGIGEDAARDKDLDFQYDRVFGPRDTQEDIFGEVVPLVHSGMEGYKVCIFAYGQTGSGKTYTMEGEPGSNGLVYKAIDEIFGTIAVMEQEGWVFRLSVKFVEIYNENIRDLLCEDAQKVEIRHVDGKVCLNNCSEHEIRRKDEIVPLLEMAMKNRATGTTMSNKRSSRSHSVLLLRVDMENQELKEHRAGTFNFIDLAGSERLNASKAEGERLRETQNINKSLSALGNVVTSLVRKEQHIPFRDSKLTFLLKDCLQGNARVLMFVNIAPEARHYCETTCSLRFGYKVSECKLGPARRNFYREVG